MPSFSSNKGYTIPTPSGDSNAWGGELNTTIGLIDQNLGGTFNVSVAGSSNYTVGATNAANLIHRLTGVLTGNIQYIFPAAGSLYVIDNQTTGAFTVTAITTSGSSVGTIIPQGSALCVYSDGQNVYPVNATRTNGLVAPTLSVTGAATVGGGLGVTGSVTATGNISTSGTGSISTGSSGTNNGVALIPTSGSNNGYVNFYASGGSSAGSIGQSDGAGNLLAQVAGSFTGWKFNCNIVNYGAFAVTTQGNYDGVTSTIPISGYLGSTFTGVVSNISQSLAHWYYGGSLVGTITTNGSSVSYNTTSDRRLKLDQGPVTGAGDVIDALLPRRFVWRSDVDAEPTIGLYAQDVKRITPWAVTDGSGEPKDEDFKPMMLDNSKLVPLLIAAIQELRAENQGLSARLLALEAKEGLA